MLYGMPYPLGTSHAFTEPLQALDDRDNLIGVIVCKLEPHRGGPMRGYIAMLATREEHRGKGIASKLVRMAVEKMKTMDADEVSTQDLARFPVLTSMVVNACPRSPSKPKLTTHPPCVSTRNSASYVRSVYIGTISMETQLFDWFYI